MLQLSFRQTKAETMVRIASSLVFSALSKSSCPVTPLSELTEESQYGFTASATGEEVGPKFVRITDLKDGGVGWETVPYCKCDRPDKYLLRENDILFARTGATTGKTYLVRQAPHAVFASYLIRVRPKERVYPSYLEAFFQSDAYWFQIMEGKKGSAQPNLNGRKLMTILVPEPGKELQIAVSEFIGTVRARQYGSSEELPSLPAPLSSVPRMVARVDALARRVEEARWLRRGAVQEADVLAASHLSRLFDYEPTCSLPDGWNWLPFDDLLEGGRAGMTTGPFGSMLHKSDIQPEGVPILGIANISANRFVPGFNDCVSPEKANELARYLLDEGDIVVARSGTVGRSCVVPAGLGVRPVMSSNLIRLRVRNGVFDPWLLCQLLNGSQLVERHKERECRGSTRVFFTQKILFKLQLPVPPPPVQFLTRKYVERLQAKVHDVRRLQDETQQELDALMPSILAKAFAGEL